MDMFHKRFGSIPHSSSEPEDWIKPDPDRPPKNRTAWDDEFDGRALDGKWTIMEDAGGNYTISFAYSKCIIAITTAAATTYRYVVLLQPAPEGKWRVRAKFTQQPGVHYVGTMLNPLIISSGKWVQNGVMNHSDVAYDISCRTARWTNNTYNGNDFASARVYGPTYYQELEYDGTNVIFRVSHDGVAFVEWWSEATATHLGASPTGIMVGLHPYNALNNYYKPAMSIDWFRRMA